MLGGWVSQERFFGEPEWSGLLRGLLGEESTLQHVGNTGMRGNIPLPVARRWPQIAIRSPKRQGKPDIVDWLSVPVLTPLPAPTWPLRAEAGRRGLSTPLVSRASRRMAVDRGARLLRPASPSQPLSPRRGADTSSIEGAGVAVALRSRERSAPAQADFEPGCRRALRSSAPSRPHCGIRRTPPGEPSNRWSSTGRPRHRPHPGRTDATAQRRLSGTIGAAALVA